MTNPNTPTTPPTTPPAHTPALKRGRPSFKRLARRNNELPYQSNEVYMQWINAHLEEMNPGEWFVIDKQSTKQLIEKTLRVKLNRINKRLKSNFIFHKHKTGDWWIWHCPVYNVRVNRDGMVSYKPIKLDSIMQSGPIVGITDSTITFDNRKPAPWGKKRKPSKDSIHAPLPDILSCLGMTEEQFNAKPWPDQLKLRIETGIKLRNERVKRSQLIQVFNDTRPE